MGVNVIRVGMVTALGLDWHSSCAAARAGIRHAAPLDYFRFQTAEYEERAFVTGHPIDLLTRGFEGFGRLARLLAATMRDLSLHPETRHRTANDSERTPALETTAPFYLSIPDPERAGPLEIPEPGEGEEPPPPPTTAEIAARLATAAAGIAQWPTAPPVAAVSTAGHAGFAEVLDRAIADISSGSCAAAIAGGVDSLLDEDTLRWLAVSDRLKHPGIAVGAVPGEGCALLLLSRAPDDALCSVEAVNLAAEKQTVLARRHSDGAGLWQAAAPLFAAALAAGDAPSLTSDHNGELYRAREFGGLLLHRRSLYPAAQDPPVVMPAVSFGDTGAASGALAAAYAAHSFTRRYAKAPVNLVLSTSDGPPRGAILLRAANGRNHGV